MRKRCRLAGMLLAVVMIMSCFSFAVSADGEYMATGGNVWYTYTLDYEGTLNVVWQQEIGQFFCLDLVGKEHLEQVKNIVVDMSKLQDYKEFYIDGFGCRPEKLEFTYTQNSKTVSHFTIANFHDVTGHEISFKDGTTINCCRITDMFELETIDFIKGCNVEALELTVECDTVKIPSGIKKFDEGTFFNCYKMKNLYIPESVASISEEAFSGCNALTDVYYAGTEEQWESLFEGLIPDELADVTVHFGYKTGWVHNDDGTWSYVEENLDEATGWKNVGNSWYFFDAEGKMLTGWQKDEGKWYYLDPTSGAMKTGWLKDGSKWYFLKANGEMATGWEFTGNQYNLFDNSGAMKTGWLEFESTWYYWDSEGKLVSGWLNDNGKWYYLYPELAWELQTIDGVDYYFDETSGAMVTGWRKIDGEWYYFKSSGAMQTGWVKDGDTYYYFDDSGVMQTGWVNDGGTWYYLKSNGAMAAGEYCEGYWLNANGAWTYQYKFSWKQDSTGWYYIATNGWYVKDDTVTIDGTSYEFDGSGYIKE